MNIILASKSPRRREVMTWMDIPFATEVCTEPELVPDGLSPEQTVSARTNTLPAEIWRRWGIRSKWCGCAICICIP